MSPVPSLPLLQQGQSPQGPGRSGGKARRMAPCPRLGALQAVQGPGHSALLPPPSSLAAISEGPNTPLEVEAAWVERARRARLRPGPLSRKEGTDFSSGSKASHPPGFLPPAARVDFVHLIWGWRSHAACAALEVTAWNQTHRVEGTFATTLRGSVTTLSKESAVQAST